MMPVIIEPGVEAKAQFGFVPLHVFRLLFHWREPKGLSGVLCLSSWRQFSCKIPICCISIPSH